MHGGLTLLKGRNCPSDLRTICERGCQSLSLERRQSSGEERALAVLVRPGSAFPWQPECKTVLAPSFAQGGWMAERNGEGWSIRPRRRVERVGRAPAAQLIGGNFARSAAR